MSDSSAEIDNKTLQAINFGRSIEREIKGSSPILFLLLGLLVGFFLRGLLGC